MKKNPLDTLNPGQIITITEGYYHNGYGVFKVLKPITNDVLFTLCEVILSDIRKEMISEYGEEYSVLCDEITEAIPRKLIELGYIELINTVELHLGDGIIAPVIYGEYEA